MLPISLLALAAGLLPPTDDPAWIGADVSTFSAARNPTDGVLADFDGDGVLDLAVTHWFSVPKLSIVPGLGQGRFGPATHYPADPAFHLVAADIDGDGDLDVVVSDFGTNGEKSTVSIYRNAGDGSFSGPQKRSVGQGPRGLVAADLDGDGDTDLAVALHGTAALPKTTVAVLRNDGTGTFAAPVTFAAADASSLPGLAISPWRLSAGDLDGDGDEDLAVACGRQRVSVLLNDGNAAFAAPATYAVPGAIPDVDSGVVLLDVEHDGDLDLVFSSGSTKGSGVFSPGAVALLRNQGDGSLGAVELVFTHKFTNGDAVLATADVDADGFDDILMRMGSGFGVLPSDGVSGFGPSRWTPTGDGPVAVAAADLDGDGDLDAAVTCGDSQGVAVHLNPGDGDFRPTSAYLAGSIGNRDVALGDIDADGDLDAVVCGGLSGFGGHLAVVRNLGDGTYGPPTTLSAGSAARRVALVDLDGDLDLDLVWAADPDGPPYDAKLRLNDGAGNFGPIVLLPVATCGTWDMTVVDLDGDGDRDLVLAEALGCFGSTSQYLYVLENLGGASFAPAVLVDGDTTAQWGVTAADLDEDGVPDLVSTTTLGLDVLLGHGDLTFDAPLVISLPEGQRRIVSADFDGDGHLDVATQQQNSVTPPAVWVLLGDGLGALGATQSYATSPSIGSVGSMALDVLDVDADGDLDLLAGQYDARSLSFLENQGDGTFARQRLVGAVGEITDAKVGDVTGDGRADVVVAASLGSVPADGYGIQVLDALTLVDPWVSRGQALAGSAGAPVLAGDGSLVELSSNVVRLSAAKPSSIATLVIGLAELDAPFKGGVLVPDPLLIAPWATDADGVALLPFVLASGTPAGVTLVLQAWIPDASGPVGLLSSNGLVGTTR